MTTPDQQAALAEAVTKRGGRGFVYECPDKLSAFHFELSPCPRCREATLVPKPDSENRAWLKKWMLANVGRAEELVLVIRERFAGDLEYTPDASKEAVEFMLRMTPDELAACLLEAEGRVE